MFDLLLPTHDLTVWWPGIIVLGIVIGFLTGMFGVGGGFLLTPFLKIVFGLPYPYAVGCSIALIFCNAILAVLGHWRKKSVDTLLGGIMAVGAILGTEIGVRILAWLDRKGIAVIQGRSLNVVDVTLNSLFLVLMMWVCISILLEISGKKNTEEIHTGLSRWLHSKKIPPILTFTRSRINTMSLWIPLVCALLVGIFTGLLGIGGGFINLPLLIYVIGTPTLVAVGTSLFTILFASAYGTVRHALEGNVIPLLVGLLFVGSFAGVKLGITVSYRFGGRKVRRSFVFIVAAGIVIVVWDIVKAVMP